MKKYTIEILTVDSSFPPFTERFYRNDIVVEAENAKDAKNKALEIFREKDAYGRTIADIEVLDQEIIAERNAITETK